MDPALLREHQAFLKKASSTLAVEKRKVVASPRPEFSVPGPSKRPAPSSSSFDYKTAQLYAPGTDPKQKRFSTLAAIVRYMKTRHLDGDTHALSLEEIMEEANLHGVPPPIQAWLENDALPNNLKIQMTTDGSTYKFSFKPKFNIRTRKDIVQLLKTRYRNGEGGVLREELEECVPRLEKNLQVLGDSLIQITRPNDKKAIVFYNEKSASMEVDEDFKKYWRSISVEKMTDEAIEQSLEKSGISLQAGEKKVFLSSKSQRKPSSARRRGKVKLRDNAHLESVLHNFNPV